MGNNPGLKITRVFFSSDSSSLIDLFLGVKRMNTREMCEIIDLFRGVELRDGGDFDGLDRKSSTYYSSNSTFHPPRYLFVGGTWSVHAEELLGCV